MPDKMPGMKFVKIHALILALSIFCITQLVPVSARAEEPSHVPSPIFDTRYFKEGDPEITTSKCIGNPITPLCAAETWLSIGSYDDDHLSDIAFGKRPGTEKLITEPPYNPVTFCYQIRGYWHFLRDDKTLAKNDAFVAGDVGVQIRHGVMENGGCNLFYNKLDDMGLLLRKGPYGWYVVNFHPMIDYVRRPEFYSNKNK